MTVKTQEIIRGTLIKVSKGTTVHIIGAIDRHHQAAVKICVISI